MLDVRVLTLFPDMFPGILGASIPGNAMKNGLWNMDCVNIRDFAKDKHNTVDDTPFGGGPGMVMKPDVIDSAIESGKAKSGKIIYLSPRGKTFDQAMAKEIAQDDGVTFLCGRYEGIDQRVIEKWDMVEVSVGDFVLSGGEPAVQVMLDAIIRLLPGALGDETSLDDESFEGGLLEYSHYTRPQVWQGHKVPSVLVSGHHGNIEKWRLEERKRITKERRPDMWDDYVQQTQD